MAETRTTEAEGLREEIRACRERIVELVCAYDHIVLQTYRQIECDYALKIGCWEVALLEAELACKKAKRSLALARARVNDGLDVEPDEVAKVIDDELTQWTSHVKAALANQSQLLQRLAGQRTLTPAEARRLKRLWRTLAKRLHPDLHPGDDPERDVLFSIATEAYRDGNLALLQSLEVSTRGFEGRDDDLAGRTTDELHLELELLQAEENVAAERVEEAKASATYQLGEQLQDAEWVTSKVMGLKASIAAFDESRREYDRRYRELLEECHGR